MCKHKGNSKVTSIIKRLSMWYWKEIFVSIVCQTVFCPHSPSYTTSLSICWTLLVRELCTPQVSETLSPQRTGTPASRKRDDWCSWGFWFISGPISARSLPSGMKGAWLRKGTLSYYWKLIGNPWFSINHPLMSWNLQEWFW